MFNTHLTRLAYPVKSAPNGSSCCLVQLAKRMRCGAIETTKQLRGDALRTDSTC